IRGRHAIGGKRSALQLPVTRVENGSRGARRQLCEQCVVSTVERQIINHVFADYLSNGRILCLQHLIAGRHSHGRSHLSRFEFDIDQQLLLNVNGQVFEQLWLKSLCGCFYGVCTHLKRVEHVAAVILNRLLQLQTGLLVLDCYGSVRKGGTARVAHGTKYNSRINLCIEPTRVANEKKQHCEQIQGNCRCKSEVASAHTKDVHTWGFHHSSLNCNQLHGLCCLS